MKDRGIAVWYTSKRLRSIFIVNLAALVFYGNAVGQGTFSNIPPPYGSPSAPLTFTLWGSVTCPFTKELLPILKRIVDESGGTVNIEWHSLPVHDPDPGLHVLALSTENQFWKFTNHLFQALDQNTPLTWERIVSWANIEGVSEKQLTAGWNSPTRWEAVKQDYLAAGLLGVKKTPGLFFGGYFLTPNGLPQDLPTFERALRDIVRQARQR